MKKTLLLLTLFLFILISCRQVTSTPSPAPILPTATPPTEPVEVTESIEVTEFEPTQQPTKQNSQQSMGNEAPPATSDPPPATLNASQLTYNDLIQNQPLPRDPVRLAIAYDGIPEKPLPAPQPVSEPLLVGTRQQLKVLNIDSITIEEIDAELKAVGDHAYFWFERGSSIDNPTSRELQEMADGFDEIYGQVTQIFGSEDNPGIDGDPRIHVVNADPGTLCDNADYCGLLGYFSATDIVPAQYDSNSNEREMFVMNGQQFGTIGYLDTLAHEFRHMVESNYDSGDIDWNVEGSAVLAQDLLGYPADSIFRANYFLQNPDQQLNSWPDYDTTSAYGQGYLLNRYIYNRLGPDLYREFATHPGSGLASLTAVATENNLDLDGESVWLDWLVALAIHDKPGAGKLYELRDGIETAVMTAIQSDQGFDDTVHQYAADYYEISSDQKTVTIEFQGNETVPLITAPPASGERMWLANRANYSQAQLTHPIDLTNVDQATLNYKLFHDIELGYDFAYVAVSIDNGHSWQPLVAENMQGLNPAHDPSNSAHADRFYTHTSNGWVQETVDLSPYAGQDILLRFEYITDEILTHAGIAFDDINIPEINFYDDAESLDKAWTADGFVRATSSIPQQWHLQLITFPDDKLQVQHLTLDENTSGTFIIDMVQGEQLPILIVAASAPMTLQPASYSLTIN